MSGIRKRSSGKWQGIIRINGKQHSKSFDRKIDAQKWRAEMAQKSYLGEFVKTTDDKISSCIDEFLNDYCPRNYAETSIEQLKTSSIPILRFMQNKKVSDLDEDMFFKYFKYRSLIDEVRVSTIKNEMKVFRGTFKYLKLQYDIRFNDSYISQAFKRLCDLGFDNKSKRRLSDITDESYALIRSYPCKPKQGRPALGKYVLLLAIETGMRRNEIFLMKRDQINWADQVYYLESEKSDHIKATDKKGREVPLSRRALAIIRIASYLSKNYTDESERIFPYKNVKALGTAARQVRDRLKLSKHDVWLHGGRHDFTSRHVRENLSDKIIMKMTGHTDPRSLTIYTNLKTADVLNKIISR